MHFILRGARLVDATKDIAHGIVGIEGTCLASVREEERDDGEVVNIDTRDMIVMPGFIDVHTHGGGGYSLHTTRSEEIQQFARWAPQTGVSSFLIAVVGAPDTLPEEQVRAAVGAIKASKDHEMGAEPLGIHLEGPYISTAKRGAHAVSWLRVPKVSETERVLELTDSWLRLITIAPELPGAHEMIRQMVKAGVTVSMGHTDATYEQAKEAIALGVTHVTHCYNAMRPLLHRAPGPLAALAEAKWVSGELIADGVHVYPAAMRALIKLLGPERTVVITDALAGASLDGASFEFAGQHVHVAHGAAHLEDGTITGSVLTMDQALRNMLAMTQVSLQDAVRMLTFNPARSAQVTDRKGCLEAGYDADLVLLDQSMHVQATFCRGEVAFATKEWKERLAVLGEQ